MGLDIVDEQYNGLAALYANVGKWVTGQVKFSNFYTQGSGTTNKFSVVNNAITRQVGTWEEEGFIDGMSIQITFNNSGLPNPQNPVTFNKTVSYVNGNVMYLDSALAGYGVATFPTSGSYSGMLITANTTVPQGAEFYFNLSPSGSASNNSVIDGQVNRFEVQGLDTLAVSSSLNMTQLNLKSGGLIKNVVITRTADTTIVLNSLGSRTYTNFTIDFEFLQWGIVQDGFNPPSYYNAAGDITPTVEVNTSVIYGNPNGKQVAANGAQFANTGFFDENFNGGQANYTKESISWEDLNGDPIEQLDYSNNCTFTAIINAENQDTTNSIYRIGLAFLPLDPAIYQNQPNNIGHQILLNAPEVDFNHSVTPDATNRVGYANDAGAQFDMDNLQFEIISATQVRVTGRIKPINTADETINYFSQYPDGERRMVLFVQVGDYTKVNQYSDEVNVLVYDDDNYNAPTLGVQIPDVISEEVLDHGNLDVTSSTFPNTTTEDDVLYKSTFLLPEGSEYEGVRARIYAHNTTSGEEFTLEDVFISFDNVPFVNGIHEANEVIPRNFVLSPNSNRNHISLVRNTGADTGTKYGLDLEYGFLNNWRYWLAQSNANAAQFFNASQANNGLNKDWQHYDLVGDWILRLSYYTRLDGVDDFNNYQFKIRPYEDDINVTAVPTITRVSDGSNPTAYIGGEMHELQVDFVWNQPFTDEWAMLTMENKEGARIGVISSVNDHGGDASNPFQPLAGETKLKLTNLGTTLRAECLVDASNINVSDISPTYRVFSNPRVSTSPLITTLKQAAYAYSFRKVSTDNVYPDASPCLRVERDSDNTRQDIGFIDNGSGVLVLDTASMLTFVGAGEGRIAVLYDQSGNGKNQTQVTYANMPIIVSGGAVEVDPNNSLPAANFDGVDDVLNMAGTYSHNLEFYDYAVFSRKAAGFNSVCIGSGAATPVVFNWKPTNDIEYGINGTFNLATADTTTGDFLITVIRDSGADVRGWLNSVALATSNVPASAQNVDRLGESNGDYHEGFFQEAIGLIGDREADRVLIENYVNGFYSIY